jgi:hypothetical protein
MSVSEMLSKMSSYEVAGWIAYYKIQATEEQNKQAQGGMMNKLKKRFKR